jgi:hypothetical protein
MLTQEMNALAREITGAQDARMAAMAKLHKSSRAERDARNAAMAKLRRSLRVELGRVRPNLARGEAARAAGVKTWMQAATADRVGAHVAWQELTVTLHGKRVAAAKKPAATPAEPVAAAKTE